MVKNLGKFLLVRAASSLAICMAEIGCPITRMQMASGERAA